MVERFSSPSGATDGEPQASADPVKAAEGRCRSERLWAQRAALEELIRTKITDKSCLDAALQRVTEVIAIALEVERASIWKIDRDRGCYTCIDLNQDGRHTGGMEFSVQSVPEYLRSMGESGIVAAVDAARDWRTAEFREGYLEPLGIKSMLDAMIYVRGEVYGILCAESCGRERAWEEDEKTFILSASNIVSLYFEAFEREAAVRRVTEAHDRLATVLRATNDCVWDWDIVTNQHWWSDNFRLVFGYNGKEKQFGVENWIGSIHPMEREQVVSGFKAAIESDQESWSAEYRFRRGDNSYAHVLDRAVFTRDASGQAVRATGSVVDISELRRSETRFRLATLAANELIWEWNLQTDEVWWSDSPKSLEWFGKEKPERTFNWCISRVHEEDREAFLKGIRTAVANRQEYWTAEHRILVGGGRVATVVNRAYLEYDHNGEGLRMIGSIQDITEKKELEAKFLRAQRLESIGTLASGVAHDLNNVLAPILMGTQVMETELTDPELLAILENMRKSAERGTDIVRQLLTFAKGAEGEKQALDVTPILRDMVKIARQTFPKNISVTLNLEGEDMPVQANLTQLHQVLLNLSVNARDAMSQGGTLTLSARNFSINESNEAEHPDGQRGEYVKVTVGDTGCGMSADTLEKIFLPFFTTKGPQKGTGLGLPTVLGIVKGHGGFIEIKTEIDKGSEFAVFLPAAPREKEIAGTKTQVMRPKGKGQTVLLVDDDEAVLETTARVLRTHGYRVLTATHGVEALAMFSQATLPIDLMVTDMLMPFMDGLTLTRSVREYTPNMKVIVSSGIADLNDRKGTELGDQFRSMSVSRVLSKPYGNMELLEAVHAELGFQA
jgi:signal transduction histidine kinase/CheY-like chemotaxis protein